MGADDSIKKEGAAVYSLIPFHSISDHSMLTKCLQCPKHFAGHWGLSGKLR